MEQEANPRTSKRVVRLTRPSIVALCGPAAAGKSSFANRHFRPTQVVSSDRCRSLVCNDERDERFSKHATTLLQLLIELRLSINRLCVVDSPALTPESRRPHIELARKFRVPLTIVVFDVEFAQCLERDRLREHSAGQPLIEEEFRRFREAQAALPQEGYDQIVVLREDDLFSARFEIVFRPITPASW